MNTYYLNKAESLTPKLKSYTVTVHGVKTVGCGESVVFDMKNHIVGFPKIYLNYKNNHPDAPIVLKLNFAENEKELSEDVANYNGWISKGWIQEETFYIDYLPYVLSIKRRYAFRFIKITVLSITQGTLLEIEKIAVKGVTSAPERIDICGNTRLEKQIDKIAIKTLSECMQTEFEDGPKRDRRLWLGDLRLQAIANYCTFKHNDLVKRCLYLFAGLADDNGRLAQSVFTKPYPQGDCGSNFDYPLLFIPTLRDFVKETDDRETAEELYPVAVKQIEIARGQFDGDVIRDGEIGWCFIDWSLQLNRQVSAQGVYLYSELALIELSEYLGIDCRDIKTDYENKRSAALKEFYNDGLGLFVSGKEKQVSYASQIWCVLAGIAEKDDGSKLLENVRNCKEAVKPVTPYLIHHYVQALIDCGQLKKAEEVMCSYWGGMVKNGADTFWELYNPENPDESPYGGTAVNSYCHAWSCTPCYFIRKYFLKVK